MTVPTALKQGLARVGQFWQAKQYGPALTEVQRLLELSPANPRLLVMRAQLAQLQDAEGETPTLDTAWTDLRLAARLDQESPVPLIELGYFCYAVRDDAEAATKWFREAILRCKELLQEALLGHAKALAELGRDAEAMTCLAEIHALRGGNSKAVDDELLEQFRDMLQHAS